MVLCAEALWDSVAEFSGETAEPDGCSLGAVARLDICAGGFGKKAKPASRPAAAPIAMEITATVAVFEFIVRSRFCRRPSVTPFD